MANAEPSANSPARLAMLARAEAELERGEAAAALDDFERAALMLHAADAELGLIRSAMQDGQYRRALAFCAHTAGEHTEEADAGVLYAWLLRAGGQAVLAQRVLDETRERVPEDVVVASALRAFGAALPGASGVLLEPSHRVAPWPVGVRDQGVATRALHHLAGAVLVGDGSVAIVPFAALDASPGGLLWVRTGLGQMRRATLDRSDQSLAAVGVGLLRLQAPLGLVSPPSSSASSASNAPTTSSAKLRTPFAGSPGYVVQFASSSEPAWPWLLQGFFGGTDTRTGFRRLGFDTGAGPLGAAVFDAKGSLVGLTMGEVNGATTWLPASAWQSAISATARAGADDPVAGPSIADASSAPFVTQTPDVIYESGLRIALQVLVEDDASKP